MYTGDSKNIQLFTGRGGGGGGGTKHVKESIQVFLVNVHLTEIDQWL